MLKFLLTEGEKIVIFYFTNGQGQAENGGEAIREAAEFGLISSLISIVCRFIF